MIVNAGNEDFIGDLKGFLPDVDKSNLLTITNRLLGSRDNFFVYQDQDALVKPWLLRCLMHTTQVVATQSLFLII